MIFILITVVASVLAQLLLKSRAVALADQADGLIQSVIVYGLDLGVWLSLILVVTGSLAWAFGMRILPVNKAYPWMSLNFIGVTAGAQILLGESISTQFLVGVTLICAGLIVISKVPE